MIYTLIALMDSRKRGVGLYSLRQSHANVFGLLFKCAKIQILNEI